MFSEFGFSNKNSNDWLGLIIIILHIGGVIWILLFILISIIIELDPFFSVFEFILPSPYERDISTILIILLIRTLLTSVCVFELIRFTTLNAFIALFAVHTMLTCVHQLIGQSAKSSERTLLKLYTQLRATLGIGDKFVRCGSFLLLSCLQFILTIIWAMVIKCWDTFPPLFQIVICIDAVVLTLGSIFMLPKVIQVSEKSKNFVSRKQSQYQTFNRRNAKYYNFCRWRAQRLLPIKLGAQLTLCKDTPVIYLDVLLANITNVILLVNP